MGSDISGFLSKVLLPETTRLFCLRIMLAVFGDHSRCLWDLQSVCLGITVAVERLNSQAVLNATLTGRMMIYKMSIGAKFCTAQGN